MHHAASAAARFTRIPAAIDRDHPHRGVTLCRAASARGGPFAIRCTARVRWGHLLGQVAAHRRPANMSGPPARIIDHINAAAVRCIERTTAKHLDAAIPDFTIPPKPPRLRCVPPLPASASHPLYRAREAETGSPSDSAIKQPSNNVIVLIETYHDCIKHFPHWDMDRRRGGTFILAPVSRGGCPNTAYAGASSTTSSGNTNRKRLVFQPMANMSGAKLPNRICLQESSEAAIRNDKTLKLIPAS